jgi:hypothetical protein
MPIVAFLLLLLTLSDGAWACTCADESIAEKYSRASIIVRARVVATSLHKNPRAKGDPLNPEIVRADARVLETLKGAITKRLRIESGANYRDPVCNIGLLAGAEYLFVLGNKSVASKCNSWLLDGDPDGNEVLKKLRALK